MTSYLEAMKEISDTIGPDGHNELMFSSNSIPLECCGDDDTETYMARGHLLADKFLEAVEEAMDRPLDGVYFKQVAHGFWKEEPMGYVDANEGDPGAFPVTFITLY